MTCQAPLSTPLADPRDLALVAALRDGLPLSARPYAALGGRLGMSEAEVLSRLRRRVDDGTIRRFGAIVRHHEAGFGANAMVVLAPPAQAVRDLGLRLAAEPAVTLCYQRAAVLPDWPYTLYCMIHGRSRGTVTAEIDAIILRHGLAALPRQVLFSKRRFKQTAGRYGRSATETRRAGGDTP